MNEKARECAVHLRLTEEQYNRLRVLHKRVSSYDDAWNTPEELLDAMIYDISRELIDKRLSDWESRIFHDPAADDIKSLLEIIDSHNTHCREALRNQEIAQIYRAGILRYLAEKDAAELRKTRELAEKLSII